MKKFEVLRTAFESVGEMVLFLAQRELSEITCGDVKEAEVYAKKQVTSKKLYKNLLSCIGKPTEVRKDLLGDVIAICDSELCDINPDFEEWAKKCRDSLSSLIRA